MNRLRPNSRVRRRLVATISATLPVTIAFSKALGADFPSAPDFRSTVDYVSWYRSELPDADGDENAYRAYAAFMPELEGSRIDADAWVEFRGMLTTPDHLRPQGQASAPTGGWPPGPWRAEHHPNWASSVHRTAAVLKKFRAAAKRGVLVAPVALSGDGKAGRIVSLHYAYLHYQRECAQGLLEAAWEVNDDEVSAKRIGLSIEAILRTAKQMNGSLSIDEQAAAIGLRTLAYENLRWAFALGVFNEKNADNVAKILRKFDGERLDASPAVSGECAKWLDALQYIFSPFGGGKGQFNGNRYREMTGQSMGGGNRFGIGARLETDSAGAGEAILRGHQEMARLFKGSCSAEKHGEIVGAFNAMRGSHNVNKGLFLGGPRLAGLYSGMAQAECERRGAILLAALYEHKAKKGKWPAALDDLDAAARRGAGEDSYCGRPFKYLIVGESPVLYSVGPDCDDDGGVDNPIGDGDLMLWPIPDSERWIAVCKLNMVPQAQITKLSAIGKPMLGKSIVVAGEVGGTANEISDEHGRIHRVKLDDGGEAEVIFYKSTADGLAPYQMPDTGMKLRARVKVIEENGAIKLLVEDPGDLAIAR